MRNIPSISKVQNPYITFPSDFDEVLKTLNEVEIAKLNRLINEYNENDHGNLNQLNQIQEALKQIANKYPSNYLLFYSNYHLEVNHKFFYEIKEEFNHLGIQSLPVPANSLPKTNITTAYFSDIIANMTPEKVDKFFSLLSAYRKEEGEDLKEYFGRLFDNNEEGSERFNAFLKECSITFLGGNNSKNFKIENSANGNVFVLKAEIRFTLPKTAEIHLRENILQDTLAPLYIERFAVANDLTGSLQITEYYPNGSLEMHAKKNVSDQMRIKNALNYYIKMAEILNNINNDGCAFSDIKNANWLIDKNDHLRIADTKSFTFINEEGSIDFEHIKNKGYWIINSDFLSPPEHTGLQSKKFNADKAHSYMFGKNIYLYLMGTRPVSHWKKVYLDPNDRENWVWKSKTNTELNFSTPIFTSFEGKMFKQIILALTQENPDKRISIADALSQLQELQKISEDINVKLLLNIKEDFKENNLIQNIITVKINEIQDEKVEEKKDIIRCECLAAINCADLLTEIEKYQFGTDDQEMKKFIKNKTNEIKTSNQESIKIIKKKLEELLAEMKNQPLVEIKKIIEILRKKPHFFKSSESEKADKLENAMGKIPLEERGNIHRSKTDAAQKVMQIIASRRLPGGKHFKVALTADGNIKLAEASKIYQKFRKEFPENEGGFTYQNKI